MLQTRKPGRPRGRVKGSSKKAAPAAGRGKTAAGNSETQLVEPVSTPTVVQPPVALASASRQNQHATPEPPKSNEDIAMEDVLPSGADNAESHRALTEEPEDEKKSDDEMQLDNGEEEQEKEMEAEEAASTTRVNDEEEENSPPCEFSSLRQNFSSRIFYSNSS